MALNREKLDPLVCACGREDCENDTLYFHGKCHPAAATWTRYEKATGTLLVTCAECDALVAEVSVA